MATSVFLFTVAVIPVTVLLVFAMKYASAAFQARSRLAGDAAYRSLAEAAIAAQAQTREELAGVAASLSVIERILKDVE